MKAGLTNVEQPQMPYITFKTADANRIGLLTRRVLIGRQLSHGAMLTDPNVSRLHAWLDPAGDIWVITDAGSKTGTFVNDKPVLRQELADGDEIRVGEVRILYHADPAAPTDAAVVDLSEPNGLTTPVGILFDCVHCGAPIWVSSDLAGKRGLCRHCRKPVTVPIPEPAVEPVKTAPAPVPAATASTPRAAARCAVCHAGIQPDDAETICPECDMHFHTECWQENLGCSSYGCSRVDILNPNPKTAETEAVASTESSPVDQQAIESEEESASPWAIIALAASVLASLLGAIMFGIPAAVVAVWSIILLVRGTNRKAMLALAVLICIAGVAGGLIVSDFYYYNSRHLPVKVFQ